MTITVAGTLPNNAITSTAGLSTVEISLNHVLSVGEQINFASVAPGGLPLGWADWAAGNYWYNGAIYNSWQLWLTASGFTYTNATATRYYTNASGRLATVAANVLRFNHAWNGSAFVLVGALIEAASENLIFDSNNFGSANWASNGTVAQNATGPDGSNSAWTLTPSGGLGRLLPLSGGSLPANSTYSFYAKAGASTHAFIDCIEAAGGQKITWFNLSTGVVGTTNYTFTGSPAGNQTNATMTPLANGWYRCSVTYSAATQSDEGVFFAFSDSDLTESCTGTGIAYQAQVENLLAVTSIMPTTGETASRDSDIISRSGTLSAPITVYANFETTGAGVINSAGYLTDGIDNSNYLTMPSHDESGTRVILGVGQGTNFCFLDGTLVDNTFQELAVSYGPTASIAVTNGAAPQITTGYGSSPPLGMVLLTIGSLDGGNYCLNGNLAQWGMWTIPATAAQLQALTGSSMPTGGGSLPSWLPYLPNATPPLSGTYSVASVIDIGHFTVNTGVDATVSQSFGGSIATYEYENAGPPQFSNSFPPSGRTTLPNVIPSYLYEQYQDDDDLQAFVGAYNQIAQQIVNWFNSIDLPIYTGLSGVMLDWVAEGLYGQIRPSLSSGRNRNIGPFNTYALGSNVAFNSHKIIGPSNVTVTSDDIFQRIITWNFWRGDGSTFDIRWLKRRIMRFLIGVNGSAPNVDQTYQISVTFGVAGQVVINLLVGKRTVTGGAIFGSNGFGFNTRYFNQLNSTYASFTPLPNAAILAEAIESGALLLPFQFDFLVIT